MRIKVSDVAPKKCLLDTDQLWTRFSHLLFRKGSLPAISHRVYFKVGASDVSGKNKSKRLIETNDSSWSYSCIFVCNWLSSSSCFTIHWSSLWLKDCWTDLADLSDDWPRSFLRLLFFDLGQDSCNCLFIICTGYVYPACYFLLPV